MVNSSPPRPARRRRTFRQPMTPSQLEAMRRNMAKARAARREMPESYRRSRFNALKHGLHVRTLDETFEALGDDPAEYRAFHRLVARLFVPQDDREARLVLRLADTLWQRQRLFHAQARWEKEGLDFLCKQAPAAPSLDAVETERRAQAVMEVLLRRDRLLKWDQILTGEVERRLRALLRVRKGGDPGFRIISREMARELAEDERQDAADRLMEVLASGAPEARPIAERLLPAPMRSGK